MTFDHAIIKPYFDLCVYIQVIIIYMYTYMFVGVVQLMGVLRRNWN